MESALFSAADWMGGERKWCGEWESGLRGGGGGFEMNKYITHYKIYTFLVWNVKSDKLLFLVG